MFFEFNDMKKIVFIALFVAAFGFAAKSQSCYWVMLTDKNGTTFDPYSYFDAKAIERYQLNGADLYDISNYPLNESYVQQIDALATEEVGQSRWFNAVGVTATAEQIEAISRLPFVKSVVLIGGDMQLAGMSDLSDQSDLSDLSDNFELELTDQLIRMGGKYFRDKGIDGSGVRIAVFDGGFPQVNTHTAFKHLRDNNRIIKTWNFPNKKENVYGWNSHGTMTLSCIAGCTGDNILGLATGAEFLLARTEVNTEPFKEEVWWQMAVEWADQNGAQIISSSLGYGKDRYYTRDMNGQSYVAKAGNMAARKGILVCNSAGNEGSDRSWLTIITPSDADSVLCVGGITYSLDDYDHIFFSSYGPSADGRQKPNVVAFGHAYTANVGSGNDRFHFVDGTSFSCPLVAGFAACALQAKPGLTAMQLFHEIEKSADLYPYCDYTFGYGVPQASYFTGDRREAKPTFKFEKKGDYAISVIPLQEKNERCFIFIKNSNPDGSIINYEKLDLSSFTADMRIDIIYASVITVHYNGYTESYNRLGDAASCNPSDDNTMHVDVIKDSVATSYLSERPFTSRLNEKNFQWEPYVMFGLNFNTDNEIDHNFWSPAKRIGVRGVRYFSKAYGLGFGLEYGRNSYRFGDSGSSNTLETMIGVNTTVDAAGTIYKRRLMTNELSLELFQHLRFLPAGMMHKGLYWDLGAYISVSNNKYRLKYSSITDLAADYRDLRMKNVYPVRGERLQYGITTRLTYDVIGIYGRYNLNRLGKTLANDEVALPTLEIGLQLTF